MSTLQFDAIDQAWTLIDAAFPGAYANASPEQRQAVAATRAIARDAWCAALNKVSQDSDPSVQQLTERLAAANQEMGADAGALKQVCRFLSLATSAAKSAAGLAALAAQSPDRDGPMALPRERRGLCDAAYAYAIFDLFD
jgi:hypothetical protein